MRVTLMMIAALPLHALVVPSCRSHMQTTPFHRHTHAVPIAAAPLASRSSPMRMVDEEDASDWGSKVFTAQNAAPWLVFIAVLVFEGFALLARLAPGAMPPALQQLIPLVLGEQYAPPS